MTAPATETTRKKLTAIRSHLNHIIDKYPLGISWLAVHHSHLNSMQSVSLRNHPRLLVCHAGEASYRIPSENGAVTITLKAGDSLFISEYVGVEPLELKNGHLFSLLFRANRIVTSEIRHDHERSGVQIIDYDEKWDVPRPILRYIKELNRLDVKSLKHRGGSYLCRLLQIQTVEILAQGRPEPPQSLLCNTAIEFIEENSALPLTLKEVADNVSVHPNYICKLLRKHYNNGFAELLRLSRFSKALLLLKQENLKIHDISHLCGFSSRRYFIQVFREHYGTPPLQMRKRLLNRDSDNEAPFIPTPKNTKLGRLTPIEDPIKSCSRSEAIEDAPKVEIYFINHLTKAVELFWTDYTGRQHSLGILPPDETKRFTTQNGHTWLVSDLEGRILKGFITGNESAMALITKD